MLDGIDAGEDRVADSLVAVGVGGDLQMQHMRLVGDRLHLLEAQLLPADAVAQRKHAARSADLDHLGAIFVHPADLGAALGRAVDHRLHFLVVGRRQAGVVTMAAGRADGIGRRDDPRPRDPAAVDRLLQPDIVEIVGSDVAHRGEPRVERLFGVGDARRLPEAVGIFETLIAADFGQAGQMDVHVDQARQQRAAREVDMLDVRAPAHRARVADAGDPPVVADEDRRMIDIAPGRHVEHAVGGHHRGGRRGNRKGHSRDGGEQQALHQTNSP